MAKKIMAVGLLLELGDYQLTEEFANYISEIDKDTQICMSATPNLTADRVEQLLDDNGHNNVVLVRQPGMSPNFFSKYPEILVDSVVREFQEWCNEIIIYRQEQSKLERLEAYFKASGKPVVTFIIKEGK